MGLAEQFYTLCDAIMKDIFKNLADLVDIASSLVINGFLEASIPFRKAI